MSEVQANQGDSRKRNYAARFGDATASRLAWKLGLAKNPEDLSTPEGLDFIKTYIGTVALNAAGFVSAVWNLSGNGNRPALDYQVRMGGVDLIGQLPTLLAERFRVAEKHVAASVCRLIQVGSQTVAAASGFIQARSDLSQGIHETDDSIEKTMFTATISLAMVIREFYLERVSSLSKDADGEERNKAVMTAAIITGFIESVGTGGAAMMSHELPDASAYGAMGVATIVATLYGAKTWKEVEYLIGLLKEEFAKENGIPLPEMDWMSRLEANGEAPVVDATNMASTLEP